MKRVLVALLLSVLVLTFNVTKVWAQATAQISGVAHDQSGAVLPGV